MEHHLTGGETSWQGHSKLQEHGVRDSSAGAGLECHFEGLVRISETAVESVCQAEGIAGLFEQLVVSLADSSGVFILHTSPVGCMLQVCAS